MDFSRQNPDMFEFSIMPLTESRRSITGYISPINGTAISWSTKRQVTVPTSTTEAEYYALDAGVKEVIRLRNFLMELNFLPERQIPVFCDNNGAI